MCFVLVLKKMRDECLVENVQEEKEKWGRYARESRVDELSFDVSDSRVTIFLEVAEVSTSNVATT